MSKYPLDQNDMQEQYEDLLIKAALKEHARKESASSFPPSSPGRRPFPLRRIMSSGRLSAG